MLEITEEDLVGKICIVPGEKIRIYSPSQRLQVYKDAVRILKPLDEHRTFFIEQEMFSIEKEGYGVSFMSSENWKTFALGGLKKGKMRAIFLVPRRVVDDFLIFLDDPEGEGFEPIYEMFSRPPWEVFSFLQSCPKDLVFPPRRPSEFVKYISWESREGKFVFNGWNATLSGKEEAKMRLSTGEIERGGKKYYVGPEKCRDYLDEMIERCYRGKDPFGVIPEE